MMSGKKPIEQCGPSATDMQKAGRRRCKANPDRRTHRESTLMKSVKATDFLFQ
jgi:hypothetical protein